MLATKQSEIDTAEILPDQGSENASIYDLNELLEKVNNQVKEDVHLLPIHFSFSWNNISLSCQLLSIDGQSGRVMKLVADLGNIPFSGENRERRLSMLKSCGPLYARGDFQMDVHSHLLVTFSTEFSAKATAQHILEVLTITLLDARSDMEEIISRLG